VADEMTHERNSRLPKVGYYLIAVALLGILFWALWREVSPQTKYQREFAHRFSAYLSKVEVRSTEAEEKIEEEKIKDDPEYQRLYATYKQLVQQEDVQAKGLKVKLDEVDKQLGPVRMVFVNFRDPSNKIDYEEWEKIYRDLKKQRDDLARQLDALMKPSQDALDVANAFISARMTDLTPDQLDKLREKYVDRKPALNELQISVPDANLVDRLHVVAESETGPIRAGVCDASQAGALANPRSCKVRLHPVPWREWSRNGQRRAGAWQLQKLAEAVIPQGIHRNRMPNLPYGGQGAGRHNRIGRYPRPSQRHVPAGLCGVSSVSRI
jgi:hypothetical protein